MDYNQIITKGQLIYASKPSDENFRRWSVSHTICNVDFLRSYDLTKLDCVVLFTLEYNNSKMYENELATALGFNVKDDFDAFPKRYADKAEIDIFDTILNEIQAFGLIYRNQNIVGLTNLGRLSLKTKKKYTFHQGAQSLMQCFDLEPKNDKEYKLFPFRDSLGIATIIQEKGSQKSYDSFNTPDIEDRLFGTPSELVARLRLQINNSDYIYSASETTESRLRDVFVDFRLYEYNGLKYPLVFYEDHLSVATNDLLFKECNRSYINHKVHLGEYLYLVKESGKPLDYTTLSPYFDIWNLDDFLESEFLVWSDDRLFEKIAEVADGSQWSKISALCPTKFLEKHLLKYKDSLNWIALSERYDDDFIINNATIYPWDFESLSSLDTRDIEFIKKLILIEELHGIVDWDWEKVLSQVDDCFVMNHISTVPFDMYSVTQKYLQEFPSVIVEYPERNWNWKIVSEEANLEFMLTNISQLAPHVYLEIVMTRAFSDSEWSERFCDSIEFTFSIINHKKQFQYNYHANSAPYIWTTKVIDWHEKLGLITWTSDFSNGFECNPNLVWNQEIFEKYKSRKFSFQGFWHISRSVTDTSIIDNNIDFQWCWPVLSTRDIVFNDKEFIKKHLDKLTFSSILPNLDEKFVTELYYLEKFRELASEQAVWALVTKYIEKGTILSNIQDERWDWDVITETYCPTLNLGALSRLNLLDKLNWNYISENADIDLIKSQLSAYQERWNWYSLSRRIDHDFIISNIPDNYDLWDWHYLLSKVITDEDLTNNEIRSEIAISFSLIESIDKKDLTDLWKLLTTKFSTHDILNIISETRLKDDVTYKWDYSSIYNRSDFEIMPYLEKLEVYGYDTDWEALSKSQALERMLKWDRKVIKSFRVWEGSVLNVLKDVRYKWDFKYLSLLDSINWCDSFLRLRTSEWDWDYLSEYSGCFSARKDSDLVKHIQEFSNYLNFSILSKRSDHKVPLGVISLLVGYPWDWYAISSNKSFELSHDFIEEHHDWNWDWSALSSRKDCHFSLSFIHNYCNKNWDWCSLSGRKDIVFDTDTIIALIDKDWDWDQLVERSDIEFNYKLISRIVDKDIKWDIVCQREDTELTIMTLELLKDKELDWNVISERTVLNRDVIIAYKDKLNWKILTKSMDFSKKTVLSTFKKHLDWSYVSKSERFPLTSDNLEKYKDYIDWNILCGRSDFLPTEQMLADYEDKVDWHRISQMGSIHFTRELVDRFIDKWDWVALSENPTFWSSNIAASHKQKLNIVQFYKELKSQREYRQREKPYIYHFTHLFNAIEIIKSHKILSRNRAQASRSLKYDAAGSVVHRSAKAHPYARFYFRTGTQTQFYNECLGRDRSMKYYTNALKNGLPMCPMPVFFRFDLQEVLTKHPNICYYSTGNLQTNWASIVKIIDNPNQIDSEHLYGSIGYDKERNRIVLEKRQQEFLVNDEFDFSDIKDFQIICYDRVEADILKSYFKDDPICDHIFCQNDIEEDIYENENPSLYFTNNESNIKVTTYYEGDYIFEVKSETINRVKITSKENIISAKKGLLQLDDYVSIEKGDSPFEIYYVNTSPYARTPRWLIYQYEPKEGDIMLTDSEIIERFLRINFEDNLFSPEELITALEIVMPRLKELYDTKIRHYVLRKHSILVSQQFEKYAFRFNSQYLNIDLMRIILALHDVGKAISRADQHEHTLTLVREFWKISPFTNHELKLAESLLKNDNIGCYFQDKYGLESLKSEILADSQALQIKPDILLQYKMILYQCDVASYTKDAGGLKYLEHMFEYQDGNKVFDEEEGLILMSPEYKKRYNLLKSAIL